MATNVSSVTSHFPDVENGFTTTAAGIVSSGATTVTLNSVSGYTNGEPVVLVIDPTDASKKQTFTGIVDTAGVQITSVVWTAGTNQSHALGATVVDYATATHIAMMSKGIKVSHNQDGTMITSLPLTTPKITTSINDSNGNEVIKTPATTSAVNEITVTNAATGGNPVISATGGDSAINLNLRGKGLAKTVTIGAGATTIFPYDYVVSGCVWSGDSYGSTRAASMTAGVVVINGNPVTVSAVSARTFTASKDVYVDVLDNGDGTGLLVYTDNTTNAASPALASNSIRIAIIVVGASSIAAATSVNQGQETMVLPIASSIPYAVTDSLGNLICPRDPHRKLLGYRQIISTFTSTATSATDVDVTGLSAPVIVPDGRKVKITVFAGTFYTTAAAGQNLQLKIKESSTVLNFLSLNQPVVSYGMTGFVEYIGTPTAGSHTYKATILQNSGAGTMNFGAGSATQPAFIKVELI